MAGVSRGGSRCASPVRQRVNPKMGQFELNISTSSGENIWTFYSLRFYGRAWPVGRRPAHVDSNSPQISSGVSCETTRVAPPSPSPPSNTTPPQAAPVQHQQQQQQHKQRQGVKGSQTGRRQRAPAVSFDESVERFWAAVFKGHPQGSGGPDPAFGNMEYAEYSDGSDYPEYSDPDGFIPQSQVHPVHPTAQDDPGLFLSRQPRGGNAPPPQRM